LLNVLAKAGNASGDQTGPRELAFNAFKNLPWPMQGENGQIQSSNKSDRLRNSLVDYFRGRPYDLDLSQQIGRIVDSASLPRPASAMLWDLGLRGTNHKAWQEGDPPTIFQIADRIKQNYSKNGENGDDVLRNVIANI